MHGSMRRREATPASRLVRAAPEPSRRPYILDVFSRYIVGWAVQYRENAQLARALIEQATEQQQITPKILTLHADRGAPQREAGRVPARRPWHHENTFAAVHLQRQPLLGGELQDAEVPARVPARFDSIEQAREHCRTFVDWYNHAHRHSGIGLMTPAAVHHGQAQQLHAARAAVLDTAFARNPERFVRSRRRGPASTIRRASRCGCSTTRSPMLCSTRRWTSLVVDAGASRIGRGSLIPIARTRPRRTARAPGAMSRPVDR